MWPLCTATSPLWLLLPLLIGLLTGWWAWGGRAASRARLETAGQGIVNERMIPSASGRRDHDPVGKVEPLRASADPRPVDASQADTKAAGLETTPIGIMPAFGPSDDLLAIKGIGPKLNDLLKSLGVRRFDQIAAWGPREVAKVDEHLGAFRGRIEREEWIEQARLLARGALSEFEARFGGPDTSAT